MSKIKWTKCERDAQVMYICTVEQNALERKYRIFYTLIFRYRLSYIEKIDTVWHVSTTNVIRYSKASTSSRCRRLRHGSGRYLLDISICEKIIHARTISIRNVEVPCAWASDTCSMFRYIPIGIRCRNIRYNIRHLYCQDTMRVKIRYLLDVSIYMIYICPNCST